MRVFLIFLATILLMSFNVAAGTRDLGDLPPVYTMSQLFLIYSETSYDNFTGESESKKAYCELPVPPEKRKAWINELSAAGSEASFVIAMTEFDPCTAEEITELEIKRSAVEAEIDKFNYFMGCLSGKSNKNRKMFLRQEVRKAKTRLGEIDAEIDRLVISQKRTKVRVRVTDYTRVFNIFSPTCQPPKVKKRRGCCN